MSRRRMRGEGGLTQRADGRWQGSYTGSDGRRHYLYAATRREASDKLRDALRDKALGVFVAGPSQATGTFLTAWLAHNRDRLAPRTVERYAGLIRLHVSPIAEIPLRKLQPQHIADLYASLRASQSPASVAQLHAVLHSALRQAVEWGSIARNPAAAVRSPKSRRREMQALSRGETHALLEAVRGDELEALYVLALMTGMRQGELLALRWRDVERDRVEVNATLNRVAGQWLRQPTKTAASRRSIPLNLRAIAALKAHRIRQAEMLLPMRQRTEGDVLVFLDRGRPINGFHVTERALKPLLRRAGLPVVRFHDLRHTAASLMLSDGVPPHIVAKILGHSSPAITMSVYAHLIPGDMESAVARLERAVGSRA